MLKNSDRKKGTYYLFRPTNEQIIEITERITESNTSPLLNGDNDLVICFPFTYRNLFAERHELKYTTLYFLVWIYRGATTGRWIVNDIARGRATFKDIEIEIRLMNEDTQAFFNSTY